MSDLFATPWTVAHQAPLSREFPRQESWSGLPFPFPGDLPDTGIGSSSPALAGRFFTAEPPEKPLSRSLACCSPWGRTESDMTEQLNNSSSTMWIWPRLSLHPYHRSTCSYTLHSRHAVLLCASHVLCPSYRGGLQAWGSFISALRLVSPSPTPTPPSDFHFTATSLGKPSCTAQCSLGCYL